MLDASGLYYIGQTGCHCGPCGLKIYEAAQPFAHFTVSSWYSESNLGSWCFLAEHFYGRKHGEPDVLKFQKSWSPQPRAVCMPRLPWSPQPGSPFQYFLAACCRVGSHRRSQSFQIPGRFGFHPRIRSLIN